MSESSKYRNYMDDNLVVEGGVSASIERMRRLRDAMKKSEESSNKLGERTIAADPVASHLHDRDLRPVLG